MLAALLLLAAGPETAVEAERAFNRAAQTEGQWTAFRKFATDDAVVFTPQPEPVKTALPAKDPPIAVQWWPADSFVSCDGNTAVNTGPWVRPRGVGYFTTVWERQPDGRFKWVVDGGDALEKPLPLPVEPRVRKASCKGTPFGQSRLITFPGDKEGRGASDDETLRWGWTVDQHGARVFTVELWMGTRYREVLRQEVAAPK